MVQKKFVLIDPTSCLKSPTSKLGPFILLISSKTPYGLTTCVDDNVFFVAVEPSEKISDP